MTTNVHDDCNSIKMTKAKVISISVVQIMLTKNQEMKSTLQHSDQAINDSRTNVKNKLSKKTQH